jgi:hypothetical protein
MRPLRRFAGIAVLDWVEVDIIHVRGEILLIADGLLPASDL